MAIQLPELPYAKDALAPHISSNTLEFHHGKHHRAYVDNLNKLIAGTQLENNKLEEIIKTAAQDQTKVGIFNNAARSESYIYWNCLKPGGGARRGRSRQINEAFGSYEKFVEVQNAGLPSSAVDGPGWCWRTIN